MRTDLGSWRRALIGVGPDMGLSPEEGPHEEGPDMGLSRDGFISGVWWGRESQIKSYCTLLVTYGAREWQKPAWLSSAVTLVIIICGWRYMVMSWIIWQLQPSDSVGQFYSKDVPTVSITHF